MDSIHNRFLNWLRRVASRTFARFNRARLTLHDAAEGEGRSKVALPSPITCIGQGPFVTLQVFFPQRYWPFAERRLAPRQDLPIANGLKGQMGCAAMATRLS